MNANAIEIRGLQKRFSNFQLGPLDLTVPCGAIYGFIGPNGAGKTTTIDLLFGMGEEDAGEIRVLGLDHDRDEVAVKRQVGYVSPELNYMAWGRVGRVIQFVRKFYPTWDDEYCGKLLESFRIGLGERVLALSFGARIKLALLLALSWRPRVLVLDEPTVGLDAISKQQVFSELLAAVREGERTVLISSHGLTDLERFADHIGMIKHGRLLLEGPTSEVTNRFRMVDLVSEWSIDFRRFPGVVVQKSEEHRWRALVDLSFSPLEAFAREGVRLVAETPVTLEELFISLGRE